MIWLEFFWPYKIVQIVTLIKKELGNVLLSFFLFPLGVNCKMVLTNNTDKNFEKFKHQSCYIMEVKIYSTIVTLVIVTLTTIHTDSALSQPSLILSYATTIKTKLRPLITETKRQNLCLFWIWKFFNDASSRFRNVQLSLPHAYYSTHGNSIQEDTHFASPNATSLKLEFTATHVACFTSGAHTARTFCKKDRIT